MKTLTFSIVALMLLSGFASAQEETTAVMNAISTILCVIVNLLIYIAGGVAMVVIVMNGIKWTASSDDPGARKQAKQGIVHAIIGLLLSMLAILLVTTVIGAGNIMGYAVIEGCG
ncbi:MAG: hypothetical protein ABH950_08420 [Candidatus Altiarchaeota archaeon]